MVTNIDPQSNWNDRGIYSLPITHQKGTLAWPEGSSTNMATLSYQNAILRWKSAHASRSDESQVIVCFVLWTMKSSKQSSKLDGDYEYTSRIT